MIVTQKLSAIRKQLEKALTSTGAGPFSAWTGQIASAKRKGDRTEVMEPQAIPRIGSKAKKPPARRSGKNLREMQAPVRTARKAKVGLFSAGASWTSPASCRSGMDRTVALVDGD